ncbi:hypothetical protein BD779DRAFT_778840 [Infundibulicybe gibba]|nr:hypothetical protein BD779DRAFT_778840 [Infundibulicybe gibba]
MTHRPHLHGHACCTALIISMQPDERLPPHTARIGQACYKCFKAEAGANLRKCSTCLRVAYCSVDCQKADWARHKAICKAFDALEKMPFPLVECPDTANLDVDKTNELVQARTELEITSYRLHLQRALTTSEKNLVGWEPKCMACGRTDRDLRREAARNNSPRCLLIPCSDCRMTFYCCTAHQEAIQGLHTSTVPPDVQSQCQINQAIRADIWFADIIAGGGLGPFIWAPERTKGSWSSVRDLGWMDEFAADFQGHGLPETIPLEPWIRGASVALSMPMSILWALEMLNGVDEGWTRKSTLTIHIMGAHELEISNGQIFEEILHRLPEVTTLDLILCDPQISQVTSSLGPGKVMDMETCPECQSKRRKRLHHHYSETYHGFMRGHGATLPRPDLAVAFNSGASEMSTSSWQETMEYLVQNRIPSLFTAYNQEEARGEAELLTQAGAQLVFGPGKNPWGSIKMTSEPMKVSGFYAANEWIAGTFGG